MAATANEKTTRSSSTMTTAVWGITPPLSIETPTRADIEKTSQLFKFLQDKARAYGTEEATAHRRRVLGEIYAMECDWVRSVAGENARCALFTAGSYRMGVSTEDGDIDALIVVPCSISRERFFADWTLLLQERNAIVSKAVAIPLAFVPIIKCVWRGVDVDLLFAAMDASALTPQLDLASPDDRALEHVHDETSVRSLNGVRVADRVLRLVPSPPVFRMALRFVKHWAKRRAVYSNSLGFLGGIAWALLVARVCQLYPNACAYAVVRQFFTVFAKWQWPSPVLLAAPSDAARRLYNGAAMSMPQWDASENARDRAHLMPILTPAFPSQNCTYNVGQSTFRIICDELRRATMLFGNSSKSVEEMLECVCEPSSFFDEFSVFLRIDAFVDEHDDDEDEDEEGDEGGAEGNTKKKQENDGKVARMLAQGFGESFEYMRENFDDNGDNGGDGDADKETNEKDEKEVSKKGEEKQEEKAQTDDKKLKKNKTICEYERDAWFGIVESKLRFLTGALEYTKHVSVVRPFPKAFCEESPMRKTFFFALKFAPTTLVVGAKTQVDITSAVNEFLSRVYAQQPNDSVGCSVSKLKRADLPPWTKIKK